MFLILQETEDRFALFHLEWQEIICSDATYEQVTAVVMTILMGMHATALQKGPLCSALMTPSDSRKVLEAQISLMTDKERSAPLDPKTAGVRERCRKVLTLPLPERAKHQPPQSWTGDRFDVMAMCTHFEHLFATPVPRSSSPYSDLPLC